MEMSPWTAATTDSFWQARPVGSAVPKYLHNEPGMEVWGSQTCLLLRSLAWITKRRRGIQRYLQNQHTPDFEEGCRASWRPGIVVTLFQFLAGYVCRFYSFMLTYLNSATWIALRLFLIYVKTSPSVPCASFRDIAWLIIWVVGNDALSSLLSVEAYFRVSKVFFSSCSIGRLAFLAVYYSQSWISTRTRKSIKTQLPWL